MVGLNKFLDELNKKFIYQSDSKRYGCKEFWNTLDLEKNKVYGDCEDYSLTIRKKFGGDIYGCKFNGEGHAVLKLPNGKWIDNIRKKPVDNLGKSYSNFKKYGPFMIFFKYYQSYVLLGISKVINIFK